MPLWHPRRSGERHVVQADIPRVTTASAGFSGRNATPIEDGIALRLRIHERLLDLLNLSVLEKTPRENLRVEIRTVVGQLLQQEKRLLTPSQTEQLIEDVLDELLGLGPLEPLLKDETITDILINTHNTVYVERNGRLEKTDVHFQDTAPPGAHHQQDRRRGGPPGG